MPKNKLKKVDYKTLQLSIIVALLLTLSALNISRINSKPSKKVLGEEIDKEFWQSLVDKHPTYIQGWKELGEIEKAKEIDPNTN